MSVHMGCHYKVLASAWIIRLPSVTRYGARVYMPYRDRGTNINSVDPDQTAP